MYHHDVHIQEDFEKKQPSEIASMIISNQLKPRTLLTDKISESLINMKSKG